MSESSNSEGPVFSNQTLGYISSAVAGMDFHLTWKQDFETWKWYSTYSAVCYFIITSILYSVLYLGQGKQIYKGVSEKYKGTFVAYSYTKPYDPTYYFELEFTPKDNLSRKRSVKMEKCFTEWINEDGFVVGSELAAILEKLISQVTPDKSS